LKRVIEVVRKFSDSFDRTGDESHTSLETRVERGISDIVFLEEVLDIEDLGFEGFIGGGIKSKVHKKFSFVLSTYIITCFAGFVNPFLELFTICLQLKRTQPVGQVP
jgi:hypothetical protein